MSDITIADILARCEPGPMQSVGNVQIIPLITDLVDNDISAPTNVMSSTSNYGTLNLKNVNESTTIFPSCAGIITKQHAQNHALGKAKILPKDKVVVSDDAACIQETQGGVIRSGNHRMTILPWWIRETAIARRKEKEYGKLWPAITDFNKQLGIRTRGHLEHYLKDYKDQLDEFIGHFELVPNQVGAIILINGTIYGVEVAPNYEYWNSIWEPLIRECYGSMALQNAKKQGADAPPPKTRVPLRTASIKSADDILKAVQVAKEEEEKMVKHVVKTFINKKFKRSTDERKAKMEVETIENEQLSGQIAWHDGKIVYTSLVSNQKWVTSDSAEWSNRPKFKI